MKCEFLMTGNFGVSDPEGVCWHPFHKLDDAVDFIADRWADGNGDTADVIDMDTGEILLHFCDEESLPLEDWDCDYEIGFDPYMGCFSDDC